MPIRINPVVRPTTETTTRQADTGGGGRIDDASVGGGARIRESAPVEQARQAPNVRDVARNVQGEIARESRQAAEDLARQRKVERAQARESASKAPRNAEQDFARQAMAARSLAQAPAAPAQAPQSAASASGYAPAQAATQTASQTAAANAQRFAEEDRPLRHASSRRDTIDADLIAEARSLAPSPATDQEAAGDAEADEEAEAREAARMAKANAMLKRPAFSEDSTAKPKFLSRLMGNLAASRDKPALSTSDLPRSRPSSQKKPIRDALSDRFGGNGVGTKIYGKANGNNKLRLDEVGIGVQELAAVIEQNPDMVDELIRSGLRPDEAAQFSSTRDLLIGEVVDLINGHRIEAFTAKPPDNQGADMQRRILRILEDEQRGLYLHPIMFAMYTADADGDDMFVSLDKSTVKNARSPMELLVEVTGEAMLKAEWLSVAPIVDGYEEGKTARDYVREVMLSRWSRPQMTAQMTAAARSRLSGVVDAVIALSETHDKGTSAQAAAWGDLFRAIQAFSNAYAAERRGNLNARERFDNQVMSDMLLSIYRGIRSIAMGSYATAYGRIVRSDQMPDPITPSDNALYHVLDGMVMGKAPNNALELRVAMNAYLGNVQGKNAPFRFTGNFGKLIKLDKRLRIGSEYVVDPNNEDDMRDFLEATIDYAYAERLVLERKIDGKELHYKDVLRDSVIDEVGFPEQYGTALDFVMAFAESYNRNAAQINESNLVWLSTMAMDSSASSKSDRRPIKSIDNAYDPSPDDLATPLVEVYGTYSFDRILGRYIAYSATDPLSRSGGGTNVLEKDWYRSGNGMTRWVRSKYKVMTLRGFSVNNHIIMEDKERWKYTKKRMSAMRSDADVADGLLLAIADKRTSTSNEFNKKVVGRYESKDGVRGHVAASMENIAGIMRNLLISIRVEEAEGRRSFDSIQRVNDAIMALNATGYEMFNALDMDSMAGFMSSEYAEKLLEHAYDYDSSNGSVVPNADVIVGIRESMVMRWQMLDVLRICDMVNFAVDDDSTSLDEIGKLINRRDAAWDELAAKSITWRGLVAEMRASDPSQSAFAQLTTAEGKRGLYWKAPDFWASGHEGYSSIRDVMDDLDMPWPLKCDIITDVARWQTQDYQLNNFEVAFQLEVGGDSRFSLNSGGRKASLGVFNDAQSAFNHYVNHSLENMRGEVEDAIALHRNKRGVLKKTIHRLAANPWEMVHIDDGMFAEAIIATRDKSYQQTEKAQKHPASNAIYSALSLQINGGYFNDVYRIDDKLLGLQPMSSLSGADLAKILDDPSYTLTAYDEAGRIGMLNQRTLLGIDHDATEQEIWDFLFENPRLACMLRANAVCVTTEVKNRGRLGAWLSLSETITSYGSDEHDALGHVKFLCRDDPVYGGLVSLLMPGHGSSSRNERSRAQKIENQVCKELYRAAFAEGELGASRALSNLGITRTGLRSKLTSEWDKYMAARGHGWMSESVAEAKNEADAIYDMLEQRVAVYLGDIAKNVPSGIDLSQVDSNADRYGLDVESVASFWDMVQELSSAKIGISTGIEGKETHDLSYWVVRMGAKDHYADLEAIADLIEEDEDPSRFDGMWTSKGPLSVNVGEDGHVETNISELSSMKSHAGDTIVTQVPDGFDVPDRSTDSYHNPVPSVNVAMVSKRAKGAETFNLQAAKSGIDGTFSIVKMKGKYLMRDYGDGTSYPVSFFELRDELASISASQGINAARMELARKIMAQDRELGYEDLSLPNYMCMAEMMLSEGPEAGQVVLRSLEQLAAAAKHQVGVGVEEMTDDAVRSKIAGIVADVSDGAIGNAETDNPRFLLDSLVPAGKAGSMMSSIRIHSSNFARNYDLLKEIEDKSGAIPLAKKQATELHDSIMKIDDIARIWNRCTLLRDYHVVGFMGVADGTQLPIQGAGPSGAFVIGDGAVDAAQVKAACDHAYATGTTVVISADNISSVPAEYAADMIPISPSGDMAIHMFDARLNGSEAKPFESAFAIAQVPMDRFVITAEDPVNMYELADSQKKPTRHFMSRITEHKSGNVPAQALDLFPNVFANPAYKNCDCSVRLADKQTIQDLICGPNGPIATIDYGVPEGFGDFNQRVHDVNAAIRRYSQMIGRADGDTSALMGIDTLAPGDIVAWADLSVRMAGSSRTYHVLAPIIPFELHGSTTAPSSYSILQCGPTDDDGALFSIDWAHDGPIAEHGYVKIFGGGGPANKGMMSLADVEERAMTIANGMQIDVYGAAETTKGRKIGTDKRIKSMKSLMAIARMGGYNFANVEGAFPNDPDLREELANYRLPRSRWSMYESSRNPITFHSDPLVNDFLNHECKRIYDNGGNPSDYLATSFDALNDGQNQCIIWQYECMFSNSLSYENALLKFLHLMNPSLCPNGIDDDTSDTLFRLYREPNGDLGAGFDRGALQVEVPFAMEDGRIAYLWTHIDVDLAFFGQEYSGNSMPNVRGASDLLDAENTASYYGVTLSKSKERRRAAWATSGEGHFVRDDGAMGSAS